MSNPTLGNQEPGPPYSCSERARPLPHHRAPTIDGPRGTPSHTRSVHTGTRGASTPPNPQTHEVGVIHPSRLPRASIKTPPCVNEIDIDLSTRRMTPLRRLLDPQAAGNIPVVGLACLNSAWPSKRLK